MKISRVLLSLVLAPLAAHADGGAVCLHEASGPFLVTVFVSPDPPRTGPIDTSVLVQDQETGEVFLDATIKLAIHPISGKTPGLLTQATREQATNKLLKASRLDLPDPGWWGLQVFVSRGREEAVLTTKLQVAPATPRVATVWPFLLFPPVAIVLFAIHQLLYCARKHRQEDLPSGRRRSTG
jgi:hypothetical protein